MDALTSTQSTASTERIPLVLTDHSTNETGKKIVEILQDETTEITSLLNDPPLISYRQGKRNIKDPLIRSELND